MKEQTNILAKENEATLFVGDRVIKTFADKSKVRDRVARAKYLEGVVPEIIDVTDHTFFYQYVKGKMLSEVVEQHIFSNFLYFMLSSVWKKKRVNQTQFKKVCHEFYYNKTRDRVALFLKKTGITDQKESINGKIVPSVTSMLGRLDWDWLSDGVPTGFHGDPQLENVIVKSTTDFCLLDWREDFGGILEYGDIYYDFAKIYHSFIVCGEVIRKGLFTITDDITYSFYRKHNLTEFKKVFEKWIIDEGYDLYKVKILSALIYLNSAPLHKEPYNRFLYYFGRHTLWKEMAYGN